MNGVEFKTWVDQDITVNSVIMILDIKHVCQELSRFHWDYSSQNIIMKYMFMMYASQH